MFEKYKGMCRRLRMIGVIQRIMHFVFLPIFLLKRFMYRTHPLPRLRYPELMNLSATTLARKIRNRELTSEQIVRAYMYRCRDVNPYLNAIVEERYTEAINDAHEVDQRILLENKSPEELDRETPLLGVPITIKESIAVQGMSHAAGSFKLKNKKAEKDATVVTYLKKAGAIPLCVTNTPELCVSWESTNLVTGRTLNPYDFSRTPGGSSGGEAALISSAASVVGVGSDLAGSIRVPSLFTGIFGHKPTAGIVPLEGHFPLLKDKDFQNFLVVGPMTRYAEDLKLMLKVMVGPETAKELKLDSPVSITDLKIFYKEDMESTFILPVDKQIRIAFKKAIHYLRSACTFTEEANIPDLKLLPEACMGEIFSIKNIENVYSLTEPLKHKKSQPNTVVEFAKALFGLSEYSSQGMFFQSYIENTGYVPKSDLEKYKFVLGSLKEKFLGMLGTNGVFIFPSFPVPALRHGEIFMTASGVFYSMLSNTLGLPATNVPLGLGDNGLPVGLQVMAGPNQDRLCLAVAEKLENVFYGWTPPNSSGLLVEYRE